MLSEEEKNALKSLVRTGTRIIRGSSNPKQGVSNAPLDTDSRTNGIAKSGEKVIALQYDDRAGVGESIRRGEILTVESFNLGSYTFQERPAEYNPYLGDVATPWHNAKSYMLVNDTSRTVVKYLNDIEASTRDCIDEIMRQVKEYKPQKKLGFVFSKKSVELVLSEYEAVVLECAPIFEESIKKEYDVREFIRSLNGTAPNEDVEINSGWIKGSLQKISDRAKQGICSKYHSVHWMAGERLGEDITYRFNTEFGRESRNICDTICDPYMKYIVQSLA